MCWRHLLLNKFSSKTRLPVSNTYSVIDFLLGWVSKVFQKEILISNGFFAMMLMILCIGYVWKQLLTTNNLLKAINVNTYFINISIITISHSNDIWSADFESESIDNHFIKSRRVHSLHFMVLCCYWKYQQFTCGTQSSMLNFYDVLF